MRQTGKIFFNARICDGSGNREIFEGWLAVSACGVIEASGEGVPPACFKRYRAIDAGGLLLSPGFIDLHSHSDISVFAAGSRNTKTASGITTEIVGNCGLSAFPVTELNREHLENLWHAYGIPLAWKDYSTYQAALKRAGIKTRIFSLLGHNTLRAAVAGYGKKELDREEEAQMHALADLAFRQGVCGLSTGLLYVPGKFAGKEEIVRLLCSLKDYSPVYATHLRSEGNNLLEALAEAVDICTAGGWRHLHISHFKTAGVANYGKLDAALELLAAAGQKITCDAYPYSESLTQLSVILPGEWEDLPDREITLRLKAPEVFSALERELAEKISPEKWQSIRIAAVPVGFEYCQGRLLTDICKEKAVAPEHLVLTLLAADSVNTLAAFNTISPVNMERILALDYCSPATDENARALDDSCGRGHPRGAGTPAEFMRIMKKQQLPLYRAVWKLTGLAAENFSLSGIGTLKSGNYADIILWDPDDFISRADFTNPLAPPSGIQAVYAGGEMI